MAAPRKTKAKEDSPLLQALRFIQIAQQDHGTPYQTHCRFINGQVMAFDGVLAAGYPVQDEMQVCPHTFRLIDALERVHGAYSLTALDNNKLSIKTEKFRALIDCIGAGDMDYVMGDPPMYPTNDHFKRAAYIAGLFNTKGAQTVMGASVLLKGLSVVGTTGTVIIEAWHGVDMPPGLVLPEPFIAALNKVAIPIVRFGFSANSFTIHFENGAWIRTQLYLEPYPNVDLVLAWLDTARPTPVPPGFYEALKAVVPFAESSMVYCGPDGISSHNHPNEGANHACKGLPVVGINAKQFAVLEPYIKQVDFTGNEKVVMFFGDGLRGATTVAAKEDRPRYPEPNPNKHPEYSGVTAFANQVNKALDDDIPF